jgi:serpin B
LHFSSDDVSRREETAAVIGRMNRPDKGFELSTANALWVQKDYALSQDYLDLIRKVYEGDARSMDFLKDPENSRITINAWVMEKTKDRIKDLLPSGSVTLSTRLILTNAVYFRGEWARGKKFRKESTRPWPFRVSLSQVKDVNMMYQNGNFEYFEDDLVQGLSFPYEGDKISMLLLLPKGNDVAALESRLSQEQISSWASVLKYVSVQLSLPSFEFESMSELGDDLKVLGMVSAFDSQTADFSGMASGDEKLYISEVIHKAWVKVDETGTEAAAATAVMMDMAMASGGKPPEPKVFNADHPFIFLIRENASGRILFMGRIKDPSAK